MTTQSARAEQPEVQPFAPTVLVRPRRAERRAAHQLGGAIGFALALAIGLVFGAKAAAGLLALWLVSAGLHTDKLVDAMGDVRRRAAVGRGLTAVAWALFAGLLGTWLVATTPGGGAAMGNPLPPRELLWGALALTVAAGLWMTSASPERLEKARRWLVETPSLWPGVAALVVVGLLFARVPQKAPLSAGLLSSGLLSSWLLWSGLALVALLVRSATGSMGTALLLTPLAAPMLLAPGRWYEAPVLPLVLPLATGTLFLHAIVRPNRTNRLLVYLSAAGLSAMTPALGLVTWLAAAGALLLAAESDGDGKPALAPRLAEAAGALVLVVGLLAALGRLGPWTSATLPPVQGTALLLTLSTLGFAAAGVGAARLHLPEQSQGVRRTRLALLAFAGLSTLGQPFVPGPGGAAWPFVGNPFFGLLVALLVIESATAPAATDTDERLEALPAAAVVLLQVLAVLGTLAHLAGQ